MSDIVGQAFNGEIKVLKPTKYEDCRGSFTVTYLQDRYEHLGIPKFVRSMRTFSRYGVLRGLHFQLDPPMGKLIQVVSGGIRLVAVDIRPKSPTFLEHWKRSIYSSESLQVWIPAGFALGYYAHLDSIVQYDTDAYYGKSDAAIRWDDPAIGIDWPDKSPILSPRDMDAPTAKEYFKL